MSIEGLKRAAEVFSLLQQVRGELLSMGTADMSTPSGQQDVLLGHMLHEGKEAMKWTFAKLTTMNLTEKKDVRAKKLPVLRKHKCRNIKQNNNNRKTP